MKKKYLVHLSDSNGEKEEMFKENELCEDQLREAAFYLSRQHDLDIVEFACKDSRRKFKVTSNKVDELDALPRFLTSPKKGLGIDYEQYIRGLKEELYNISGIPKELLGNE